MRRELLDPGLIIGKTDAEIDAFVASINNGEFAKGTPDRIRANAWLNIQLVAVAAPFQLFFLDRVADIASQTSLLEKAALGACGLTSMCAGGLTLARASDELDFVRDQSYAAGQIAEIPVQ